MLVFCVFAAGLLLAPTSLRPTRCDARIAEPVIMGRKFEVRTCYHL